MGQDEIINFLKKQRKPVPSKDIIEALIDEMNRVTILRSLHSTVIHNDVLWIQLDHDQATKYSPKAKRRLKLYYVKK
jgi:hypothetical protein